jgi:carbamoyltransferase
MNLLGINHYFHDTSVCLVAGGKLVVALEEERFNRDKHTEAFPERAAEKVFASSGLAPGDVTHVAVSVQPTHQWPAKLAHAARHLRGARGFLEAESQRFYSRQRRLDDWMRRTFASGARPRVHFVQHHLAHAGGSFLVSGYDNAALLSIDGSGEWATTLLGHGRGNRVEIHQQSWFPMSLGCFYEAVTEWLGFQPNYDEGKTMGLAPYGDARHFYSKVGEIVRVEPDGRLWLDLSYFNHQFHGRPCYSERFVRSFGAARAPGKEAPFADHHVDVAAAFQRVLEDRALEMCEILHRRTRARRLVLAGGVALNSVMNGRIAREGPFDDVYVMPGAGDCGTSIGAAFYVWNTVLGHPREFRHDPVRGQRVRRRRDREDDRGLRAADRAPRQSGAFRRRAAHARTHDRVVPGTHGVRPALAGEPVDPRQSDAPEHEGGAQRSGQAS